MSQFEYDLEECGYGEVPTVDLSLGLQPELIQDPNQPKRDLVGPFRCGRCLGYINLHSKFISGGHKVECTMCGFITDTPPEHFSAANDGNGKIIDTTGKPQYTHGVMEYKIDST